MDLISIVVPFLNEAEGIYDFCDFIEKLSMRNRDRFSVELLFVDDGSTDDTVQQIRRYDFVNCSIVKIVSFSKNFGSHAASRAGIQIASGNYCTFMGADLQEPDEMVDVMYSNIIQGYDTVYIEKQSINISFISRTFSSIYSALMRRFAVKNYGSGGINNMMFSRKIIEELNDNIESNSSLNLQILDLGYKSTTIPMRYKERTTGKSKWTLSKKMKLFIDSFVAFSFMPIRAVSVIGIILSLIGFVYGIYIVIQRITFPEVPVEGYATLSVLLLFGFGITNISLGIIAEYLWRAYDAARNRKPFIVSEIKQIK